MNVAIIPARGGSKRIPRKNIKKFCGKPIIEYSIELAMEAGCFERIIVSTDSVEIAKVASNAGAEVPFIRPSCLSDDYSGTTPVVRHAIEWLSENYKKPDLVCCIYATAPLLRARNLLKGLGKIKKTGCDYVFSVTNYPFPIQRAISINENGNVEMFQPDLYESRSQDIEPAYHDAGQFYWGKCDSWLSEKAVFGCDSTAILLPHYLVQDIDTLDDWSRAEIIYKSLLADNN